MFSIPVESLMLRFAVIDVCERFELLIGVGGMNAIAGGVESMVNLMVVV